MERMAVHEEVCWDNGDGGVLVEVEGALDGNHLSLRVLFK